jgi:hypothetical protein
MIAAAASDDCFGGLFAKRSELPILPAPMSDSKSSEFRSALIKRSFSSWDGLFKINKLNERGWTLQERELSPRILYFTKYTMMFECREAGAGNPNVSRRATSKSLGPKPYEFRAQGLHRSLDRLMNLQMASFRSTTPLAARYNVWMDLVEGYSEEISYMLDDQYVAGLWRNDLVRGLCWRWKENDIAHTAKMKNVKVEAMTYGPSWSWAKMAVPVTYDVAQKLHDNLDLDMWDDSLNSWDPETTSVRTVPAGKDPNGTLISAMIVLDGFLFRVSRSRTGNFQILGEAVKVVWDFLPQTDTTYYILSLGKTRAGLVLVHDEYYRRAGIVPLVKQSWFKESDFQRVILV